MPGVTVDYRLLEPFLQPLGVRKRRIVGADQHLALMRHLKHDLAFIAVTQASALLLFIVIFDDAL